ncbi:DUF1353 domain-containing protein [bacterium]|nr:MAG: DUF1353 domain-containing protein [bacterium]
MSGAFHGEIITKWSEVEHRWMSLIQAVTYTDPNGHNWIAPAGTCLNGATIPKFLWSSVGSPFVGVYRRASVVHDYFVGESSPSIPDCKNLTDVGFWARRKADKMFYHACRTDGASRGFAMLLYLGVTLGTWGSLFKSKGRGLFKANADLDSLAEKSMYDFFLNEISNRNIDTANKFAALAIDEEAVTEVFLDNQKQRILFEGDIDEYETYLNNTLFSDEMKEE